MEDKRIIITKYEVLTRGGPFQALLTTQDNKQLFVHYKHGRLTIYPRSSIENNSWDWDNQVINWRLNVKLGSLEDSYLSDEDLMELLSGLAKFEIAET